MKPAGSKQKGSSFELQIAKRISGVIGVDQQKYLQRSPESGARISWKGDIVPVYPLPMIWPYHIECKKREGWNLDQLLDPSNSKCEPMIWFKEACEQAYDDKHIPLIIFSKNYRPILIAFPESLYTPQHFLKVKVLVQKHKVLYVLNICTLTEFEAMVFYPLRDQVKGLGIYKGE